MRRISFRPASGYIWVSKESGCDMTATAGLTGTEQTLESGEVLIFDGKTYTNGVTTLVVRCRSDSPVGIYVRVPETHGPSGATVGLYLNPGDWFPFRLGKRHNKVYARGETAKIDWGGISSDERSYS